MNFSEKNTFLITGGAGFIGANLVRKLLTFGSRVIVVDNFMSGKRNNLPQNDKLIVIEQSVQEFDLNKYNEITGVFHLAAQASVPVSISNFYCSSSNNNISSLKVIDFCAKSKIPLIYASSSAVYGNIPIGIEDKDIELIHPYSVDKYMLEKYTEMAFNVYGLNSCGLRFFNVYGPYQDGSNPYSGVISIFIERLLNGKDIIINGGKQTRDFIYIDDVVDAILLSFQYIKKNRTFDVLNVLSNTSISVDTLANKIARLIGITPKKKYLPLSLTDPKISVGSAAKITKELNFYPKIDIDTGLKLTISWMKEKIEK